MTDPTPTIVLVEHVAWEPGSEWREALEHVAGRFARVAPLDVDAVLAAGELPAQVEELHRWAGRVDADVDRELGRWFDENLAMHVRPDPKVTRAVRARAAAGPLHAASALGARSAESLLRHAGCWRSIAELHPDLRGDDAVDQLAASLGTDAVVRDRAMLAVGS
jgi:hypothetical protein